MLTHLKDTGSSLAVILDGPILEATKIDVTTPLEVSTDGDVIVITPVRDTKRAEKFIRVFPVKSARNLRAERSEKMVDLDLEKK